MVYYWVGCVHRGRGPLRGGGQTLLSKAMGSNSVPTREEEEQAQNMKPDNFWNFTRIPKRQKKPPHTNFLPKILPSLGGGGFPVQRKTSHRMTREKNFSFPSFKVCLSLQGGGGIPVSPSSSAAAEADNSKKKEEDPGDQGFFLVRGCLVTRGGGGGGGGGGRWDRNPDPSLCWKWGRG